MNKPSKCKNCEYAENVEFGGELLLYVKDKEIERLTAESTEWESKCYKYQDIIDELEKDLEKNYIRWEKYAKTHKEDAWRMIICKYYLDKLKELKGKNEKD